MNADVDQRILFTFEVEIERVFAGLHLSIFWTAHLILLRKDFDELVHFFAVEHDAFAGPPRSVELHFIRAHGRAGFIADVIFAVGNWAAGGGTGLRTSRIKANFTLRDRLAIERHGAGDFAPFFFERV